MCLGSLQVMWSMTHASALNNSKRIWFLQGAATRFASWFYVIHCLVSQAGPLCYSPYSNFLNPYIQCNGCIGGSGLWELSVLERKYDWFLCYLSRNICYSWWPNGEVSYLAEDILLAVHKVLDLCFQGNFQEIWN